MADALAPTPQPVVCPLAVFFFPHVLGENGCSIAIPCFMRHAKAFSSVHCFSHNAITIFPSHGRAADHSLQGDSSRSIRMHEYIKRKVPFNADFPLVHIVLSMFFSFFSITVDNCETHPSFLQSIRTEGFWENSATFSFSAWICTPVISLSTAIWVEMI